MGNAQGFGGGASDTDGLTEGTTNLYSQMQEQMQELLRQVPQTGILLMVGEINCWLLN